MARKVLISRIMDSARMIDIFEARIKTYPLWAGAANRPEWHRCSH
jgi:hypothetical protein